MALQVEDLFPGDLIVAPPKGFVSGPDYVESEIIEIIERIQVDALSDGLVPAILALPDRNAEQLLAFFDSSDARLLGFDNLKRVRSLQLALLLLHYRRGVATDFWLLGDLLGLNDERNEHGPVQLAAIRSVYALVVDELTVQDQVLFDQYTEQILRLDRMHGAVILPASLDATLRRRASACVDQCRQRRHNAHD